MKILLTVFLCLFFAFGASAQTETEPNAEAEASAESITLFRDDVGEAGAETAVFAPTDIPVHCSIHLTSRRAATVKMRLVAAKANGLRAETVIVAVSYKTNGRQNVVNFTASPEKTWAAGVYRVDVYVDGKLNKSKNFEVQKSGAKTAGEKTAPPKTVPKPKAGAPKRKS